MILKRYKGKRLKPRDKDWNKGTWYIWKRLNGRIIHKSIPEAQTKEQAELAARKIIAGEFNRRYGITQTVNFVEFANGPYTRYFESTNSNIGAKRLYVQRLCAAFKGQTLDSISPQDCRDLQTRLRKTTSDSSVNRIMSTASRLFSLACEEGVLDRNPMQYVRSLKEPPPRERSLSPVEKENLWRELEQDTLLLRLVTLAVNLPLRKGQLLAISPAAVDLHNGLLYATESKGQRARVLPLNSTAKNTLRTMIADEQLPFPLKDFRKRWAPMLVRAGINETGAPRGENFTFHDLRHYLATELISRHNVNPETVRQAFGHSDMSVTRIYMNNDLGTLRTALNQLDATNVQPSHEIDGPPN